MHALYLSKQEAERRYQQLAFPFSDSTASSLGSSLLDTLGKALCLSPTACMLQLVAYLDLVFSFLRSEILLPDSVTVYPYIGSSWLVAL